MTSDIDLEMLMARYQQGDLAAATSLVRSVSPRLHRFFVIQFSSREYADDLLQEMWLRIHKARHTYRPGEPVLPWLYAIARNIRVDHFRKSSRTTGHEQPLDETPEAETVAAKEEQRIPSLEVLLSPLPESQREVITMLKVEGMSLEEVARATSSSVGSVKQKAHRGYEKLRERLTMLGLGKGALGELP
ncbi:MAG TPA: RNA polymerase sigma factor [Candidatus Acidoferrales bacterium]|jgi:RNA polymerase sigma-70 factor (ECF subfamily)|nr:RNA polymerase sigma factor [Candidatus Acidoferrales bacterium]